MNLHELRVEDLEKQSNWSPMKKYDPILNQLILRVYYWLC